MARSAESEIVNLAGTDQHSFSRIRDLPSRMWFVQRFLNTDQGSQVTSGDLTKPLEKKGVAISMDGKGRYLDNIFVERLWRSLKYEELSFAIVSRNKRIISNLRVRKNYT